MFLALTFTMHTHAFKFLETNAVKLHSTAHFSNSWLLKFSQINGLFSQLLQISRDENDPCTDLRQMVQLAVH